MKKTFEKGMRIELTDYDTGRIKGFRIVSRDGEHAILKDSKSKTFYAKIRKVKSPEGECLDVRGFNALFSHDLHLSRYRKPYILNNGLGRPSKQAGLDKTAVQEALKSNTVGEVAYSFGVCQTTLRCFMNKHNITARGTEPLFTAADVAKVQNALNEHKTIAATAKALSCSSAAISKFVHKHGLVIPPRPKKLNAEHVSKVKEMLAKDMSKSAIARTFGVSLGTLLNLINEYEVKA